MLRITTYVLLLLLFFGCADAPEFSSIPELEFTGLLNNQLAQSRPADTIFVQLNIRDADGDIGMNSDSFSTLFFIDRRDGFEFQTIELPELSDQGIGNGVEIDATVFLRYFPGDICCRPPSGIVTCEASDEHPLDSLFYDVYVRDHDGNESNRVVVGPIFLRCD